MGIRWDAFAALVALVDLPLMANPATLRILYRAYLFIVHLVWSERTMCEVLTWYDVPSGLLHQCPKHVCDCTNIGQAIHNLDDPPKSHEDCFKSTLGKAYPRAWVSASRRKKRVHKPVQLDLQRPYVCTCRMTLRAYALLVQPNGLEDDVGSVITMKTVGGVLVAHLHAGDDIIGVANGEPGLTKAEVECILRGYPPFYKSTLRLPSGQYVRSPVRSDVDINGGGWIAGIGISVNGSLPTYRHNMAYTSEYKGGRLWNHTVMGNAVRRVGETFQEFAEYSPNDEAVQLAIEIFRYMIKDDSNLSQYAKYCSDPDYFDIHRVSDVNDLTAADWETALLLYNRRVPWSRTDKGLLTKHGKVIVHAALHGLCSVLSYGTYAPHSIVNTVTKLPPMPELDGISDRHIFLTSCLGTA